MHGAECTGGGQKPRGAARLPLENEALHRPSQPEQEVRGCVPLGRGDVMNGHAKLRPCGQPA
jgi:hypothetical protein